MENSKIKKISIGIIENIWNKHNRVTYALFKKYFISTTKGHLDSDFHYEGKIPSQPTFSRWLSEFCHSRGIMRLTSAEFKKEIGIPINEGVSNGIFLAKEILLIVENYLRLRKIFFPSPNEFKRFVGDSLSDIMEIKRKQQRKELTDIINNDLYQLPIIKDFFLKDNLIQFPPVYKGKLNLIKLEKEYQIKEEIDKIADVNGINLDKLLQIPDIHSGKEFIESNCKTYLDRCAKEDIEIYIIKYLAGRYQDSIDVIIQSFIRNARLMEFKIKKKYDNLSKTESLSLLKQNNIEFQELNDAVVDAVKTGSVSGLKKHIEFLDEVQKKSNYIKTREGFYETIGQVHKYSRKMSRRLVGLEFRGIDKNSKIIAETLKEVLEFKSFNQNVSKEIIDKLSFLKIPKSKLKNRMIFEPIVLINLANLIHGGRIIVINSRKYRNKWDEVHPLNNSSLNTDLNIIETIKKELETTYGRFLKFSDKNPEVINKGKLVNERKPAKISCSNSIRNDFLKSLKPVNIVEILKYVNKITGFIDCFKLNNPRYTGNVLSQSQHEIWALGVILAKGMNIGIKGIVKTLKGDITIGKLENFYNNYVSLENLENASRNILNKWDNLELGNKWGNGTDCSSDGKVMFSFTSNLISRFHYRKRKTGVTIYWFIRNDWIANYVQIIGNDEWESWYILEGLLNSFCDKEINKSCGDTQGQLLSLWGLARFLDKEIRVRFRTIKNIKLYKPYENFGTGKLENVDCIDWHLIEDGLVSAGRLVESIKKKKISSRDIFSAQNIFDENGFNVMDALKEIGKVTRTIFILKYIMDPTLKQEIMKGCNRAEFWNKFQDSVFWGKGGTIASNNPQRQQEIALFLMLIMNAIAFYNAHRYSDEIGKYLKSGRIIPIFWDHINFLGSYDISN